MPTIYYGDARAGRSEGAIALSRTERGASGQSAESHRGFKLRNSSLRAAAPTTVRAPFQFPPVFLSFLTGPCLRLGLVQQQLPDRSRISAHLMGEGRGEGEFATKSKVVFARVLTAVIQALGGHRLDFRKRS